MKKRKAKTCKRRRILLFGCLSLLIIGFLSFSIGNNILDIYKKYNEKQNLEKNLYSLKEQEDELKTEVEKLQDPEYVARFAREKYFYSKNGEIILIIPKG